MHIPQMEPLLVSSATLDSGNFVAAFENSQLYGLSKFKIRDINFDVKNNKIALRVDFDEIQSFSDYRVKGRILILDLNGAGKANATFCKYQLKSKFSQTTKTVFCRQSQSLSGFARTQKHSERQGVFNF